MVLGAPEGVFFDVGVGRNYACAIRVDDRGVECWGEAGSGSLDPPAGAFHRLALGEWETCAIRNDGRAVCWWTGGLLLVYRVPPSGSNVAKIWNRDTLGGCGVFPPTPFSTPERMHCWGTPATNFASQLPNLRFEELALGDASFCALDAAGGIECFLEDGETEDLDGILDVPEGTFEAIAQDFTHACALRTSGELACWGDDSSGKTSPPPGVFTSLDLARSYGCATNVDGNLTCWGYVPAD